ncbi:MAG: TrbG/VirB9 family P-type conjugative transfer protein [Sphingomonas sp.]|nr:TrbG/VirB9 family P-type conjugative transfer protein [Sphingomonas sp.]
MKRLIACLGLWAALTAETYPEPGPLDPHIQRVLFEPEQVVALKGALGWQIMIEFGADERIENVSIGDAQAWQVTPNKRARMLFLKPLIKNASTNMTVVTSQRRYAFELSTGPRQRNTPWVLNFYYPPPVVEAIAEPPPLPPVQLDFSYRIAGDPSLLPSRVWDDGRQTYFEFAEATAIPAIFAGGPGKDESLVNVAMRDRVAVAQQLETRFTLRSGKRVATVTKSLPGARR